MTSENSPNDQPLHTRGAKAWVEKGLLAAQLQRFDEARGCFEKALEIEPSHFEALHHLGLIAYKLKDYFRAIGFFQVAHQIDPNNAVLLSNLGSIYKELRLFELSKTTYLKALERLKSFAPLHFNFANLLHEMHDTEGALKSYQDALALDPKLVPAYTNGGNMLTKLRKFDEALAYYDQALSLDPQFGLAYANKGKLLKERYAFDQALEAFAKAETFAPNVAKVFVLKAELMNLMRDYEAAVINFDKAYALDPYYEFLLGLRLHNKMLYCNWSQFEAELDHLIKSIEAGHKATQPAQLLSLVDSPSLQLRACEIYIQQLLPPQQVLGPIARPAPLNLADDQTLPKGSKGSKGTSRKIKVAYLSADFKNHAVCILMAELFEVHDKTRFELFAFDSTPESQIKGDPMRERVLMAFDHVIDIRSMSDKEAAQLARSLHIDIVVDLGGHTYGSRTGVLSYRAAPVQMSYLGYLGTIGAPYLDYILADTTLIPQESQTYYTEKVAYLPCYQVNDSKRQVSPKTFSRQELGLPEKGVVYCCFNNNYKIIPQVFDAWIQILKAVPESTLLLLADSAKAQDNLKEQAKTKGLEPNRLVFGERLKPDEYLARFKTADLFLDTFPYNAGTTASDALWVGLPVLTNCGASFASRIAASALMGVGLAELITQSTEDYIKTAIDLGREPKRLHKIRETLGQKKPDAALFDTPRFTRHLENIFEIAVSRAASGQSPQNIEII